MDGDPLNAVTEEVLMMDPPAFMWGTAALLISIAQEGVK
jgi:hypothetical protein